MPANYDVHITALRERLAGLGLGELAIHVEAPFVVVGDGGVDVVKRRAGTVRWAVEHLEADFFDARPARILDIYLFGDARSYQRGVRALTGETPDTPYGFYSSAHGGLFMNIATGGGTLVHEIVHPYVEADFPGAPAWLNEGLGSLFEQSSEEGGHIVGETNWRLAGLRRRSAPASCRPSARSPRRASTPSTTAIAAPTTRRPATSSTTSRSRARCAGSIGRCERRGLAIPPATTRWSRRSASPTWQRSKGGGRRGC